MFVTIIKEDLVLFIVCLHKLLECYFFQTDLENCDYALEAGATRNFEAQRTAELMAKKEMEEKEEEDKNNPMKVR